MFHFAKLDFKIHLQNVCEKVYKTKVPLRKLQNILPRAYLVTINHLKDLPKWNLQFSAASSNTNDAMRGTTMEKLYQELGHESLQHGCWFRRRCFFFNSLKTKFQIIFLE